MTDLIPGPHVCRGQIGLCAAATLPGVIEYGHDMVYVCYDNKASINAGIQLPSSKRQKAPGIHLALSGA